MYYYPYPEKKDNTMKTLLGVGIFAGVGVGSYFLWDEWKKNENKDDQATSEDPKPHTQSESTEKSEVIGEDTSSTVPDQDTTSTNKDTSGEDTTTENSKTGNSSGTSEKEQTEKPAPPKTPAKKPENKIIPTSSPQKPKKNGILSSVLYTQADGVLESVCALGCKNNVYCFWATHNAKLNRCRHHLSSLGDTLETIQFRTSHVHDPHGIEMGIKTTSQNYHGEEIVVFKNDHSIKNVLFDDMEKQTTTGWNKCKDTCRNDIDCGGYVYSHRQDVCYHKKYTMESGYTMIVKF